MARRGRSAGGPVPRVGRVPGPDVSRTRRPVGVRPGLALALVVGLVAGLGAARVLRVPPGDRVSPTATVRGRPAPGAPAAPTGPVHRLLAERSRALATHDRDGFLATAEPAARARQAALYQALAALPLERWQYGDVVATTPTTYRTRVKYRLAGDRQPAVQLRTLTLGERASHWYVRSDEPAAGAAQPWDLGAVTVVRRPSVLVVGSPLDGRLLRTVADDAAAAVPRVTAAWGRAWPGTAVVEVPHDSVGLARLVPGDLSQLAALATTVAGDHGVADDRVVVSPEVLRGLTPAGRRVVLTHELVHVATRTATGPASPSWLVEGLADAIAFRGAGVPLEVAAPELAARLRSGDLPTALPTDAALAPGAPQLGESYEQAWLAVALLVRRYGTARVDALYRAVGRERDAAGVERALRAVLGTSTVEITRAWRADLASRAAR